MLNKKYCLHDFLYVTIRKEMQYSNNLEINLAFISVKHIYIYNIKILYIIITILYLEL